MLIHALHVCFTYRQVSAKNILVVDKTCSITWEIQTAWITKRKTKRLDHLYTIYTQAHLGCGEFMTSTQLLEQHVAAVHLLCSLDAATLLLALTARYSGLSSLAHRPGWVWTSLRWQSVQESVAAWLSDARKLHVNNLQVWTNHTIRKWVPHLHHHFLNVPVTLQMDLEWQVWTLTK